MYLYNAKTHTLHIKGYCQYAKGIVNDYISFCSENEALAYDGRAVSLCKFCQRKREKLMEERE